jgi:hypothetical protein
MLNNYRLKFANKTGSGFIVFLKFDKKAATNCGISKVKSRKN